MGTFFLIILGIIALPFIGFALLMAFASFVDFFLRSVPSESPDEFLDRRSDEILGRVQQRQQTTQSYREKPQSSRVHPVMRDVTPTGRHRIRDQRTS